MHCAIFYYFLFSYLLHIVPCFICMSFNVIWVKKWPQLKQALKLSCGVYPFSWPCTSELYCHETVPFPIQTSNKNLNQSINQSMSLWALFLYPEEGSLSVRNVGHLSVNKPLASAATSVQSQAVNWTLETVTSVQHVWLTGFVQVVMHVPPIDRKMNGQSDAHILYRR